VLDWHRREAKAVWWEYFRLSALSCDELIDEPDAISGLSFVETVGGTAKAPVHRYAPIIWCCDRSLRLALQGA